MRIDTTKIKILIVSKGFNQKTLADQMGMRTSNLSAVLSRGSCKTATACRIAEALGVDVTEIIIGR